MVLIVMIRHYRYLIVMCHVLPRKRILSLDQYGQNNFTWYQNKQIIEWNKQTYKK